MAEWKFDNSILNYEVIGKGTPIIFLHGWGHSGGVFNPIADNLKNRFCSYLIDLPGFGSSTLTPAHWNSNDFGMLIKRFIEALDLKEVVIIGHSFGGKIGALAANMIKDRVKKLVLIDSAGIRQTITFEKFLKIYMFKTTRMIKNSGILFKFGDKIYDKIERFSGSTDYLNAGKMKNILKTVVREDITSELSKVRCPTLILWGEKDIATPVKDAYKMNKLIKGSKLIIYPNAGHHLPIESPHQVAHHIKEFLSKE